MTRSADPRCPVCQRPLQSGGQEGIWVCSGCSNVPETIDGYIERLSGALRGSVITRRRVVEEVRLHLETLAADDDGDTTDRAEAERRATQQMGSPERVAAEIPHRRLNSQIVILMMILCGVAGFVYSTQQPTLYSSTSAVIYTPPSGAASDSSSVASTWGAAQTGVADSAAYAKQVLRFVRTIHSQFNAPYAPWQILAETTIAPTAGGTGIQFTTSDPSARHAELIADGFAQMYPHYLRDLDPRSNLNVLGEKFNHLKKQINHPANYGHYGRASRLTTADKVTLWRLAQARVYHEIEREAAADPQVETATIIHRATAPSQSQPRPIQAIALGALIGLAVGALLAVMLYLWDSQTPARPRAMAG